MATTPDKNKTEYGTQEERGQGTEMATSYKQVRKVSSAKVSSEQNAGRGVSQREQHMQRPCGSNVLRGERGGVCDWSRMKTRRRKNKVTELTGSRPCQKVPLEGSEQSRDVWLLV